MSSHFSRSSAVASSTAAPSRIVLIDNTAPAPVPPPPTSTPASADQSRSPSPSSQDGSPTHSRHSLGDGSGSGSGSGKRETLRRAIAERRYKRWSVNPDSGSADSTDGEGDGEGHRSLEQAPDPRAGGVVVGRPPGGGASVNGRGGGADGADDPAAATGGAESGRAGQQQQAGNGGGSSKPVGATGQLRRKKGGGTEIAAIDVLYENQRGSFVCGIPLFSSKSLLNFDPAAWQNGHFHDSAVSILDAQVPNPSWAWQWKSWYVDMTGDVDEAGWAYSFSFSPSFAWHGNHVWFHSFVRRRRWLRKRVKLPTPRRRHSRASASADSSRADSIERAGHGLGNDYFTIHSRREPGSWRAGGGGGASSSSYRRSSAPVGGSGWPGDADSDHEDADIANIPSLLRTVRRARLDREKVEAVMRFIEDGGEELTYLADEMSTLMGWMVFQASRRQLLAHLADYCDQYRAGEPPAIPALRTPSPSPPGVPAGKHPDQDTPEARHRKIDNLARAVHAADQEVKKMEFWSDVKGVARKGESATALGVSGVRVANEGVSSGAAAGDVGGKGKEKAVLL